MKKKNKFESLKGFCIISEDGLSTLKGGVGGAGAGSRVADTSLTCIHTTGKCDCTDSDDID